MQSDPQSNQAAGTEVSPVTPAELSNAVADLVRSSPDASATDVADALVAYGLTLSCAVLGDEQTAKVLEDLAAMLRAKALTDRALAQAFQVRH